MSRQPQRVKLLRGLDDLIVIPNFLEPAPRIKLLNVLYSIEYENSFVRWNGQIIKNKRMVKWYGPCEYRYSATRLQPTVDGDAKYLREEFFDSFDANSVLVNYYHTKDAALSFHADDEPLFDNNYPITSLSFGASREFLLRPNGKKDATVSVTLDDNTLVIMPPNCQLRMQHALVAGKQTGSRVNLTFRRVKEGWR